MKSSLALLNFKCLRKALHNASLKRRKKIIAFQMVAPIHGKDVQYTLFAHFR